MGLTWVSHGSPIGLARVVHGLPWPTDGLPWGSHGASRGFNGMRQNPLPKKANNAHLTGQIGSGCVGSESVQFSRVGSDPGPRDTGHVASPTTLARDFFC